MEDLPEVKFVDIDKIFKEKNPGLYKWLPRFILSYVKRITHQEDINLFMKTYGHLYSWDFVDAILYDFRINVKIKGIENLPTTGNCIVASNHPLGGLDGIALMHAIGKKRKDMVFIVNDILTNIKNFDPLFAGVNKVGSTSKKLLEEIDGLYASDKVVMIFPAGLVSRKQANAISDLDWKKSFITKSKRYKRDVVPVYISGHNSNFFYNLANRRKTIGIKGNIEMLYLPDEMYNYKGNTIEIEFGKVIPYTTFDKSKTDEEWAQWVKDKSYGISKSEKVKS